MPKLDPYPTSPWSSELPYGGHNNCQSPAHATSSTCWGKAKGSFRNCKSGSMSSTTQESIYQLTEKTEAVCYDKFSTPHYRGLMDRYSTFEYHSPGRESHSTATTSTSVGSSLLLKILGSSCFHTKSEFASSSVQKTLGRREPAETSLTNEKKKKKLDVASMKDETSSNKKMKEKAPAEDEQIPTTTMNFKEEKPKEGRKFNWADKYQPKTLRDFICHLDKAYMLQSLVQRGQSNHFIFEGAPGVGKRTMARALLREVFEPNMLETREALKYFKLEGGPNSSIRINVKMSSCHIEVNLSDLKKRQAAHVAMELIKESSAVTLNQNQLMQSDYTSKPRAIILCGAEKLSEKAQLHIRNHLEDCRGQFKVYFCYSGTSMLQNLKSLCTVVQIPTPSKEEIIEVLEFIAKHEAIELPPKMAENIAEKAKHNVRQAIRSFEATWQSNYPFREDQELVTGWEEELAEIAKNVIEEQSPKQMFVIKEKIKNFMFHNAPPVIIFETLVGELKKLLDNELLLIISDLCQDAGYFDYQNLSYKNAISDEMIEEFVAKFMSAYHISQHQQQIG